MIEQLKIILYKNFDSANNTFAVKHLDQCFLTILVKSKYLEVLLGKSGAYKSKYTLKPLLSQAMVHFPWQTKSVHMG